MLEAPTEPVSPSSLVPPSGPVPPTGPVSLYEAPVESPYIADMDEWADFLDTNGIGIDYEQALYEELGYADYDAFLTAIDEQTTLTKTDVLAAWAIVQP